MAWVVFSAWDSLAFSASEYLRVCCASAKALTIVDQVFFSSDSAYNTAASCAARAGSQYCQELLKSVKGTEVIEEHSRYLPGQLPDYLSPPGSQ
jgi:hypothetical protein